MEKKKTSFEKIMVWVIIVLALIVVCGIVIIFIRTPKTRELEVSPYFAKEQVFIKAREVIELLENDDFATIRDKYCNDEMKDKMTDKVLVKAKKSFAAAWGERKEITSESGYEVNRSGDYYAMLQINIMYEKAYVKYTIMFDVDMKLAGFAMD